MAFTSARLNAALDGAVANVTHAQLHTGAPGGAGTSNVAAGVDRVAGTFAAASGGSTTASFSFTIPAAGGPFTHVTLFNAATGGTFQGDGTLTPQETFAGAGTLDVTVTATAS